MSTGNELELNIVKSQDGKYCVVLNGRRIAGVKPDVSQPNIVQTYFVSLEEIAKACDDPKNVYPVV